MTSTTKKPEPPSMRRLREAAREVKRESFVSWPQAIRDARALADKELHKAAQGCNDIRCIRHGAINQVRHERGIRP